MPQQKPTNVLLTDLIKPILDSDTVTRRRTQALLAFEYYSSDSGSLPMFTLDAHCIVINLSADARAIELRNRDEKRQYTLEVGQGLSLPMGATFEWRWKGDTQVGAVSFTTDALDNFFHRDLEIIMEYDLLFDFVLLEEGGFDDLTRRIQNTIEDTRLGQELLLDAYSREFLIALIRQHIENSQNDTPRFPAGMERLEDVLHAMRQNLKTGLHIPEMARIAGMSRSRFASSFKETTGLAPGAFLNRLRVQEARQLLISTNASLSEIATQCGFSDQSHFNRQFKKYEGKTPRQFRLH